MDDVQLGRSVRALRHRRGWRQSDLATRAGISRNAVSLIENGAARLVRVAVVRRVLEACGARLAWDIGQVGAELARLRDADHAALQDLLKSQLERMRWLVIAEVSFNHYGERGRIDLLAFHPQSRTLVVVEIKTLIADIQELLGTLDMKVRIARRVAAERGWRAGDVAPALVVAESATARRRIRAHPALFSRFTLRGRAASAWLRNPEGVPGGLLIHRFQSSARPADARRAGRRRVRRVRAQSLPPIGPSGPPGPPSADQSGS